MKRIFANNKRNFIKPLKDHVQKSEILVTVHHDVYIDDPLPPLRSSSEDLLLRIVSRLEEARLRAPFPFYNSSSESLPPGVSPPILTPNDVRSPSPYGSNSNFGLLRDRDLHPQQAPQMLQEIEPAENPNPVTSRISRPLDSPTNAAVRANLEEPLTLNDGGDHERDMDAAKRKEESGFGGRGNRVEESEREGEGEANGQVRGLDSRDHGRERERRDGYGAELTRMISFVTATASEDWSLIMEICERASANEKNAKEAVLALRREFKYGEPSGQVSAARLWALMLKNSSEIFIAQSQGRKFFDTLENLLANSRISSVVRDQVLDVIAAASYASGNKRADTGFRGLWKRVKPFDKPDEGMPLNNDHAMFHPSISGWPQHDENIIPQIVTPVTADYPPTLQPNLADHFVDWDNPELFGDLKSFDNAGRMAENSETTAAAISAGEIELDTFVHLCATTFPHFSSDCDEPASWLLMKHEFMNVHIVSKFPMDVDRMECAKLARVCKLFPYLALLSSFVLPDLSDLKAFLTTWKSWDTLTSLRRFREINNNLCFFLTNLRGNTGFRDLLNIDIDEMSIHLYQITTDREQYRSFLALRDDEAQFMLDILQTLLDIPTLDRIFRAPFMNALLRLSKKSGLYPSSLLQHDVTLEGDYAITAGHFGDIWKGRYQGREVAVKVLRMFIDSDKTKELKKVLHEMLIWRQLRHPNVLPFLCLHDTPGDLTHIGLVSPWMENGNVRAFLNASPNVHRASLIVDIAEGLNYLHGMEPSIVHSDLKAVNILVTSTHQACLADFGLSTASGSRALQLSSFSSDMKGGTSRWMAPELLNGEQEHSTMFSDVYAFGCVCYEMFSGKVPFSSLNDHAVMFGVVMGRRPPRPSHWEPHKVPCEDIGLDDDLWDLIERCWKPDPHQRPSMREVLDCLPIRPESPKEGVDIEQCRLVDEAHVNLLNWFT